MNLFETNYLIYPETIKMTMKPGYETDWKQESNEEQAPAGPTMEFVDLGLSVKWAKCNLGAETETDYGDYYAWGEVETKSTYSWDTYTRHTNGTYSSTNKKVFIKYCPTNKESTYWAGTGLADNKLTLDAVDDAANASLGGNWRMPTREEFFELCDTTKVTSEWVTKNGINGREFTSLINGNTLFIPAAGCYTGSELYNAGESCSAWSSSLYLDNPKYAYNLYFNNDNVNP